jgi:hypothetical protein
MQLEHAPFPIGTDSRLIKILLRKLLELQSYGLFSDILNESNTLLSLK